MRPKRCSTAAAKSSTAASSPTSSVRCRTPAAPAASHSADAAASASGSRAQSPRRQPRRAESSAAARPMAVGAPGRPPVACSSARGTLAEALLLRRLVGDLEEVGEGQGGEDGGDEAGQSRREEKADGKGGYHPEAEAVRADQHFADRLAGAGPARALFEFRGAALALVPRERRSQRARHLVLGDQPADLVRGDADRCQVR